MSEVIPVRVRLTTRMAQDGQEESYQFEEDGQLVTLANGQRYLRYTEHQAGQATPVQFRFGDGASHLTAKRRPPAVTTPPMGSFS